MRTLVETGVLIGPPGAYHLGTSLDRLAVQVEHLAHHALRGEMWDKAMGYCGQAGEKALAHSAHREAVGSFEQALSALAHLPETRATREQAIDFGRTLASFEGAWRHERFGQVYLPAVQSRAWLACCHAELGMFAEGRAIGEEGLQIAEAVAHPPSAMVTSHGIGLLCLRHGDLPTALPPLERAVGICHEADLPAFFPQTAEALGAAYTLAGRVAVAVPLLTQAVEQATAMGRVDVQAICGLALGEAQLLAGRQEEAHALADRALALAHEHQERSRQAYALCLLGEIAAPALTDQPPAIYGLSMFVEVGGLMSYGPSFVDLHRRVAIYVDKLLKSAKPADLPVEQPRKFEFVINLKTPQALGLTILPTLLLQADEMIRWVATLGAPLTIFVLQMNSFTSVEQIRGHITRGSMVRFLTPDRQTLYDPCVLPTSSPPGQARLTLAADFSV